MNGPGMEQSPGGIFGERLLPGTIRLLQFLPRSAERPNKLNLELFAISLLSPDTASCPKTPLYQALSYVWGSPLQEQKIVLVNDIEFSVNKSLEDALFRLEKQVTLPVWIDAICINQDDDEEKNYQVSIMYQIYHSAHEVLIWLGESNPQIDQLFRHLEVVGSQASKLGVHNISHADLRSWEDPDRAKQIMKQNVQQLFDIISPDNGFPFESLSELSHRSWFTRVWTIQELCAAKEYAFMCGSECIPGDYLLATFMLYELWARVESKHIMNQWPSFNRSQPMEFFEHIVRLQNNHSHIMARKISELPQTEFFLQMFGEVRSYKQLHSRWFQAISIREAAAKKDLHLWACLEKAFGDGENSPMAASNPKDRIYAFLNISNDREDLAISPQYEKSITYQQVYAHVAQKLLSVGHVHVLSLCRVDDRKDESGRVRDPLLPSWTPDWTRPIMLSWAGLAADELFRASGSVSTTCNILEQSSNLRTVRLQARSVGTILKLGTPWRPDATNWSEIEIFLKEIERLLQHLTCRYTADQRMDASWKIPIGDKENNVECAWLPQRASERMHQEYLEIKKYAFEGETLALPQPSNLYLGMLRRNSYATRPFIADTGYVGLCPDEAMVGDQIFIPMGSNFPYTFRRVDAHSVQLVGETYVFAAMDGEIFEGDGKDQILTVV